MVRSEEEKLVELVPRHDLSSKELGRVTGWDIAEILREGVTKDPEEYEQFDSLGEIARFVMGSENYSDRNSFLYGDTDTEEIQSEGFFQELYCPGCVEEVPETDIEDFNKQNLQMAPVPVDRKRKSYKAGASEKHVTGFKYECFDHPDYRIEWTQTEHV